MVRVLKPQEAMIAKPQQNRATRRVLVEMLIDNGLLIKTIPALNEFVEGSDRRGTLEFEINNFA